MIIKESKEKLDSLRIEWDSCLCDYQKRHDITVELFSISSFLHLLLQEEIEKNGRLTKEILELRQVLRRG